MRGLAGGWCGLLGCALATGAQGADQAEDALAAHTYMFPSARFVSVVASLYYLYLIRGAPSLAGLSLSQTFSASTPSSQDPYRIRCVVSPGGQGLTPMRPLAAYLPCPARTLRHLIIEGFCCIPAVGAFLLRNAMQGD